VSDEKLWDESPTSRNVISLSDCGFTKVSSFTFCKKQVHTFLFHQSQNNFLKISENID